MSPPFSLGRIVATPATLAALAAVGQRLEPLLARHAAGDWGQICAQDRLANEEALISGARLMSVYPLGKGIVIWIITDATDDKGRRYSTCILLPENY